MRYRLLKLFCLTILFMLLQQARAQNGVRVMVRGLVHGRDGLLKNATVQVGSDMVMTADDGSFSFLLIPGSYLLVATHTGYERAERRLSIDSLHLPVVDIVMVQATPMDAVVVLGSRSAVPQSNMNTAEPVDKIPHRTIPGAVVELNQQLAILIPSFNSPPQTIGQASGVLPATLHGLSPDQTLVLLNGHRRHSSASIYLQSNLGYGTVAVDLNAIPSAAIENIEVLRNGAAAQYGSDAIAGIVNLELKKSTGKTYVNLHLGQQYRQDGKTINLGVNRGFAINKKGYLNVTAEFRFRTLTERQGTYNGTVYYPIPAAATPQAADSIRNLDNQRIKERGFNRAGHRPIGTPPVLNTGIVINGGYPLNKRINLFWTETLNLRLAYDKGSNTYRYPKLSNQVITALYPDGFQPVGRNLRWDFSEIIGAEGNTASGWRWDLSSTYGGNIDPGDQENSNNASQYLLGRSAQTSFYLGTTGFTQNTNNINFSRDFARGMRGIRSFNVAFGGEFRLDHYFITKGEESSWKNYAPSSGMLGGAQGVPGFQPENEVNKTRYITAGYTELEMELNEKFLWKLAGRYEYYSDFGGNLAGKLALRYKLTEKFLVRASVSNGFRAPSIQQRYFSAINQVTRFGDLAETGTYRNDGAVAAAFGISPLQAEKSVNASAGITYAIAPNINLTMDAYWIQIKSRIIFTGLIQRDTSVPAIADILNSLNLQELDAVRFFTNAINTRTSGVDLVISGRWPVRKSVLDLSLSANYNKTNIYSISQAVKNLPDNPQYRSLLINNEERGRIEQGQPLDKIILRVAFTTGKWEFSTFEVHYGKAASLFAGSDRSRDEFFSPKIVSAFAVQYSLRRGIDILCGARNLFNVYPDKLRNYLNTQDGILVYSPNGSQFGYNGGYYFLNMTFGL